MKPPRTKVNKKQSKRKGRKQEKEPSVRSLDWGDRPSVCPEERERFESSFTQTSELAQTRKTRKETKGPSKRKLIPLEERASSSGQTQRERKGK